MNSGILIIGAGVAGLYTALKFAPRLLRLAIASLILASLSSQLSAAQDGEDELILPGGKWVWFPTAECPLRLEGQGSSPEDAIEIDEFGNLYASASEQLYKEQAEQAGEPLSNEGFSETDLNCRWIKISGHFRIAGYYHYRGVLAESSRDLYLNGGAGNFIREGLYFIENWEDPSTSSVMLNGSNVTLVGRFYDLCRAARKAERDAGQEWFIMGGPCHYGDLTGLMIRDVRVIASSNPFQRLGGERNREILGDLKPLPESWPEYSAVRETAKRWVEAVRVGAEQYYRDVYSRPSMNDKYAAEFLQRSLDDKDDLIWFLATSPESPVTRQRPKLERQPFAIFVSDLYDRGLNSDGINTVTACFCTLRKCDDEWPLLESDADNFVDAYVCREIRRERTDKSKWAW